MQEITNNIFFGISQFFSDNLMLTNYCDDAKDIFNIESEIMYTENIAKFKEFKLFWSGVNN